MSLEIITDNEKEVMIEETTTDKRRYTLKDLENEIEMRETNVQHTQNELVELNAKRTQILALRTK